VLVRSSYLFAATRLSVTNLIDHDDARPAKVRRSMMNQRINAMAGGAVAGLASVATVSAENLRDRFFGGGGAARSPSATSTAAATSAAPSASATPMDRIRS
jgi:hypothetical protein